MLKTIRSQLLFMSQFRSRFETTGSIIASSRFLAKAITRYLAERGDEPIRVLECGPGTGAFTDQIVRHLRPGDVFDLVELNESFVGVLEHRFVSEDLWNAVTDISNIHQLPIQEFQSQQPYDYVISGLPLMNFPPDMVDLIMQTYFRLLKPDGTLSYFEYAAIRPIRKALAFGAGGKRVRDVDAVLQKYLCTDRFATDTVLLNLPPAWAQHLRASHGGEAGQEVL